MKYAATLCLIAGLAASANAGVFSEVEDNNTLSLANDLGSFGEPGGSILVDGVIDAGDVDWFGFTLEDSASLSFFAVFAAGDSDGVMQIVTAGGDVIAFDDNSGIGSMPAIQIEDLDAGFYYIGLSGFGDTDASSVGSDDLLDGLDAAGAPHGESFGYKLSVGFTIVPAPGALALMGMGGVMMTRRRR